MISLPEGKTAFFDVDQTLVLWTDTTYVPNPLVIEELKRHKERGHIVIVWSLGGTNWAKRVVEELQLQDFVDLVISKSDWFYDDKKAEEFMPEHIRIDKK